MFYQELCHATNGEFGLDGMKSNLQSGWDYMQAKSWPNIRDHIKQPLLLKDTRIYSSCDMEDILLWSATSTPSSKSTLKNCESPSSEQPFHVVMEKLGNEVDLILDNKVLNKTCTSIKCITKILKIAEAMVGTKTPSTKVKKEFKETLKVSYKYMQKN